MTERFFTQRHWLGIDFAELDTQLDPRRPATAEFYDAFYAVLERRYSRYSDLPAEWLTVKFETAGHIASIIQANSPVISFGAGIGVVEHYLIESFGFSKLRLYDLARNASHFDPSMRNHYLTREEESALGDTLTFKTVYLGQILYALSHSQAVSLLADARGWVGDRGTLISVDTSTEPLENGHPPRQGGAIQRSRLVAAGSRVLRGIQRRAARAENRESAESSQGWGWERDNSCVATLVSEAGWTDISQFSGAGQTFTIAKTNGLPRA